MVMSRNGRKFSVGNQRGSILILVVMLMSLLLFIPIAMKMTANTFKETKRELNVVAQADNVARAGIQAAWDWFRKYGGSSAALTASPPDSAFNPTGSDTLDASKGLVQEFDLNKGLKAHFEILKYPDPAGAHDVTLQRGYPTGSPQGMAWTVQSLGIVYQDKNLTYPLFDPNSDRVVAKSRMSAEFRRVAVNFPYPDGAALITNVQVNVSARVAFSSTTCQIIGGDHPGLVYFNGSTGTVLNAAVSGLGDGTFKAASAPDFSVYGLFSVSSARELAMLADSTVQTQSDLAALYKPPNGFSGFIYVDATKMPGGTVNFSATTPLTGSGLMYVDGNLVLPAGTNSLFNGILIVTGNLTMSAPATVSGVVMAGKQSTNTITLSYSGERVILSYDNNVVQTVRNNLLQYRMNKASIHLYSGGR